MLKDDSHKGERYSSVTLTGVYVQVSKISFRKKDKRRIINKSRLYEGTCDCGVTKYFNISQLRNGGAKSCGCYIKKILKEIKTKHGKRHTKLYGIYFGIKRRVLNKKYKQYSNYGGRGIKLDNGWENDFMSFYNWSMENGYTEGLSIDRIDNEGDYSPENCRWTDRATQNRNKRNNVKYKGECAADASLRLGGAENLVNKRVRDGWEIEKAFTTLCKIT